MKTWFTDRFLRVLLVFGLLFSGLTGCAQNPSGTSSESLKDLGNPEQAKVQKTAVDDDTIDEMTAAELGILLGNGINLGNTMEAYGHKEGIDKEVSFYETLWGQPETTAEVFQHMKEAGFDTVRIPVAWTNKMDFEHGDYTIPQDYMERVKQLVDYAYDAGLFVVLNDHWDGGWWGMFGSKDQEKKKAAMELYTSMWEQLSEYFGEYDSRLIFEGGNEEIGDRLNDLDEDFNPKGATLTKEECYQKANEINQKFVDIVRGSGGNNEKRFLLIPGYGTDITQTLDARWKMPEDTVKDKLFLSVHYYTPWSYCGGTGKISWGTKSNYQEMNRILKQLSKYTQEGYGVIIGEYGVLPMDEGGAKPNSVLWYENFLNNCDIYGYVPLLWDTGNTYDRKTGECIDKDVADLFADRSYEKEAGKSRDEIQKAAESAMEAAINEAPETFQESTAYSEPDRSIAWIMWNSGDWGLAYSVGDTYDPDTKSEGIKPTDVEVTGEGEYTVALDFTKTANGYSNNCAFSAVGIGNGEDLYPGYFIHIKKVKIKGKKYKLHGKPYTVSDDKHCTRVNLYNSWVPTVPKKGPRTEDGKLDGCSAMILQGDKLGEVKKIEVTFEYKPGEQGISTNDANSKN